MKTDDEAIRPISPALVQAGRAVADIGSMGPKLASLHADLTGRAVVLDDRCVPGSDVVVDHVVVAPSGVWLIAVDHAAGRVARRDTGCWSGADERLFVGGDERTELVDQLDKQVQAMEHVLAEAGLGSAPVHGAICFPSGRWGWFAKPLAVRGIWVAWPGHMAALVLDWAPMPPADFERLSRVAPTRLVR